MSSPDPILASLGFDRSVSAEPMDGYDGLEGSNPEAGRSAAAALAETVW